MYTSRQGPSLSRRATSSGVAQIATHFLGPHPVIAHYLDRMNLEAILRDALSGPRQGVLDHARTLMVLIHNILVSPAPLYRIAEWAAPWEAHVLGLTQDQKDALNDDRVARALDALVSERGRGIWFRLALRVIKQFDVKTDRVHFDTTTVTFHGSYKHSFNEPRITPGHNKDHRPDLKQLLFGLSVSSDGAVPLTHHVYSGNRSDDSVHAGNLENLRRVLMREDFTYVADSKLCTLDNLKNLESHGGTFVTVMPRSWREDKRFRNMLREGKVRWKAIERVSRAGREEPEDTFSSCQGLEKTDSGYRLVWIRSSRKAMEDYQSREGRLRRAQVELGALEFKISKKRGRKPGSIQKAIGEILKHFKVEGFLEVKIKERVELIPVRLKRGRPGPTDPVLIRKRKIPSLRIQRNQKALTWERRTDGVFPLITNLFKRSKREILRIYKYQPYIEKRFSALKTELEVAPVYLKSNHTVNPVLDWG